MQCMMSNPIFRTMVAVACGPTLLLPLILSSAISAYALGTTLHFPLIFSWLFVSLLFGVFIGFLNAWFESWWSDHTNYAEFSSWRVSEATGGHRSMIIRYAFAGEVLWLQFVYLYAPPERVWLCLLLSFVFFHVARASVKSVRAPKSAIVRLDRTGLRVSRFRSLADYSRMPSMPWTLEPMSPRNLLPNGSPGQAPGKAPGSLPRFETLSSEKRISDSPSGSKQWPPSNMHYLLSMSIYQRALSVKPDITPRVEEEANLVVDESIDLFGPESQYSTGTEANAITLPSAQPELVATTVGHR